MSDRWYYRLLGEEFGPVSTSDLRDLVSAGTLDDRDEVRADQSAAWQPVSVALEAVNASPAAVADTAAGGLNIDDFEFESSDAAEDRLSSDDDPQRIMDLNDLSFEFGESGDTAKPEPEPEPPPPAPVLQPPTADPVSESHTGEIADIDAIIFESQAPTASPVADEKSDSDVSERENTPASDPEPTRPKPRRDGAKKKRRPKKTAKDDENLEDIFHDENLEDIFDDVFSDDESKSDAAAPAADSELPEMAAPIAEPFPAPALAPAPAPARPSEAATSVAAAAQLASSLIDESPPAKSSGRRLSLPGPKVLLSGCAVLGAIAVASWSLGLIGGGINFGRPAVDHTQALNQLIAPFNELTKYSPDDPNWDRFRTGTQREVPAFLEVIRKSGPVDAKGMKAGQIARTMMRLAGTSADDQEARDKLAETLKTEYASYQKL